MSYNPNAGAGALDNAALVVERTTDLIVTGTTTGTANFVEFDTTGTENQPSVLEHNDTNTDRLEIKTSGLHQLAFSINVDNTNNQVEILELELRVNGTVAKTISFDISKNAEELVTRITALELTAGTYVSFSVWQSSGGASDLTLKANTIGYILKL